MTESTVRGQGAFIAVLIGAMAASTIQLFAIAVLAATIIDDLGLTRGEIGLLGAGNTSVGALIAPWLGRFTDRIGARRSTIVLSVVSGVGLGLTAVAQNFAALMAASVVSGLPQGWGNSATNKLIAERLPPGKRGTVTGLKQSGVQFSIFLAGFTLPTAAEVIGWREALAVYGLLSVGVGVLAAVSIRDVAPADPAGAEPTGSIGSAGADASGPGSSPPLPAFVYRVALYALFLGLAGGGISRFLPLFANEELGFSEARAGAVIALSGALGMVARVIWGRASDRRIEPRRGLAVLAAGSTITAALVAAATTLGGWVLWVVAVGLAFFIGAWNVVAMMAVIVSVPTEQAGRGTGIVLLGFLGGLSISSPLVGWSVDATGDYQLAWVSLTVLAGLGVLTMVERRGSSTA